MRGLLDTEASRFSTSAEGSEAGGLQIERCAEGLLAALVPGHAHPCHVSHTIGLQHMLTGPPDMTNVYFIT